LKIEPKKRAQRQKRARDEIGEKVVPKEVKNHDISI
jgi:hypothetical protein